LVDVNLDLQTDKGKRNGVITLKLQPCDTAQTTLTAVNNAVEAAKLSGVERPPAEAAAFVKGMDIINDNAEDGSFTGYLLGVVSKLDLFVQIVDKAAKVVISPIISPNILRSANRCIRMLILHGKSCHHCTRLQIHYSLLPIFNHYS
jgi:hypothetical protein